MIELTDLDKNIEAQIEARLKKAQENKQFKDIGRKAGTKKEMRAIEAINIENLGDLEENPAIAEKMVTKKKLWPEVDIEAEREKGTTSGAAFLKYEYHRALSAKPLNHSTARIIYLQFIEVFKEQLEQAKTVEEVRAIGEVMLKTDFVKQIAPEIDTSEDFIANQRTGRRIYVSNIVRHRLEKIFGKAFVNLASAWSRSDAAREKIKKALIYERFSPEQEAEIIATRTPLREKQLEKFQALLNQTLATKNGDELYSLLEGKYRIDKATAKRHFEPQKKVFVDHFTTQVQMLSGPMQLAPELKAREDDWTWYTEKSKKSTEGTQKSKAPKINEYLYLSRLERKGGLKVIERDGPSIKSKYGLSAIQYGNSLTDQESAWMTWLLNGSFSDLQEITGLDLAKINKAGALGIDFATRGTPGSAATYWAGFQVINLNRRTGDGSLAHEWGHYLDNMLSIKVDPQLYSKLNGKLSSFATEHGANDPEINEVIKEIMRFIRKGSGTETKSIEVRGKDNGLRFFKGRFNDINEALAYFTKRYPGNFIKLENRQKSLEKLAYLFGHEKVVIEYPLNSSYQYYDSSLIGGQYWIRGVELFARAFEGYVMQRMEEMNMKSEFLQSSRKFYLTSYNLYPYPQKTDMTYLRPLFDKLFSLIQSKYDAKYVAPSNAERVDESIENISLIDDKKLKPSIEEKQEPDAPEVIITETPAKMKSQEAEDTDLFEDFDALPPKVQAIISKYMDDDAQISYEAGQKMLKEMEAEGYTFEMGLDGVPMNLKKLDKAPAKKLGRFTEVFEIDRTKIDVDPKRFQGRQGEFSEDTVQGIVSKGSYDKSAEPIVVWLDEVSGKYIILSGHSRFEATKRLFEAGQNDLATVPVKQFNGTEEEAIDYATLESNRGSTEEGLISDLKAYKRALETGKNKEYLKRIFKPESRLKKLQNLSHLNTNGKFVQYLADPSASSFSYLERNAQWIGQLRDGLPALTDAHENELFDFIYLTKGGNIKKDVLFNEVDKRVNRIDFDPSQKLNLENRASSNAYTDPLNEKIKEIEKEIEKAQKTIESKRALIVRAKNEGKTEFIDKFQNEIADANSFILQKIEEKERLRQAIGKMERETVADLFSVPQVELMVEKESALEKPKEVKTHFYKKEEEAKKKATGKKFNNAERKKATEQIRKIVDEAIDKPGELTPEQVIAIAQKINSERSLYSQFVDAKSDSAIRRAPTEQNLRIWAKNPGKSDLLGVDSNKKADSTLKRDQGSAAMRFLRRNRK